MEGRMRRMAVRYAAILLFLPSLMAAAASHPELGEHYASPASAGRDLIGTRPPEWTLSDWQNSDPLTLAGLRDRVVLIRWWTAPGCAYCSASAAALESFATRYRERGLVVVALIITRKTRPSRPRTLLRPCARRRRVFRGRTRLRSS